MKKHFAILFYGMLPPDNLVMPWEESEMDWTDCIASRHKLHIPTDKFKGNEDKYEEYWKKKDELIKSLGILVEIYGSEKNTRYAFAIKDSIMYASQEFPERIDTNIFQESNPQWDGKLKKFIEILGIEEKLKAGWFLTSYSDML